MSSSEQQRNLYNYRKSCEDLNRLNATRQARTYQHHKLVDIDSGVVLLRQEVSFDEVCARNRNLKSCGNHNRWRYDQNAACEQADADAYADADPISGAIIFIIVIMVVVLIL